ncbi:MAG: ATP-dependent DNA helicase RecQ [Leptolyngbyaceae cyanobacterium MO_188.B28]|nr:ATP-dependent DNA helicase RecQ [Leptolyngbyaceae cyanobacterium MO_188.B28]
MAAMTSTPEISWQTVRSEFQRIWGYDDFRSPQGEVIQALLAHRDALIVMPTGGGKSICFQLPALLQQGLTLVISPLVALMENQVEELRQRRLPAALLHSELEPRQRTRILKELDAHRLRLLYLSPETLLSASVWERLNQPHIRINGLILDEAHCLVQWGETFRPAYRRLGAVRSALLKSKPMGTRMAIAAFTATADPMAQRTLRQVLQLQQPKVVRLNPYRSNLHLSVQRVWTPRGRRQAMKRFIQARPQQAGLVYVRTRRDSEELATWFRRQGQRTAAYHAGLGPEDRRRIEADWINDKLRFVVCTSAFGMGINRQNGVRWIFHYHAPTLLSEYVQEIGRAGRDGQRADALTLVSEPTGLLDPDDKGRRQYFRDQDRKQRQVAQRLIKQIPTQGDVRTVARQFNQGAIALSLLHSTGQLEWQDPFNYVIDRSAVPKALSQDDATRQMTRFLRTRGCRWRYILESFGFGQEAKSQLGMGCGHCDRCLAKS